jgi:hypothetical protein
MEPEEKDEYMSEEDEYMTAEDIESTLDVMFPDRHEEGFNEEDDGIGGMHY